MPISEFKEKLDRALSLGVFVGGGELDLVGQEGRESKYDAEYNYLKSIGAL